MVNNIILKFFQKILFLYFSDDAKIIKLGPTLSTITMTTKMESPQHLSAESTQHLPTRSQLAFVAQSLEDSTKCNAMSSDCEKAFKQAIIG